MKGIVFDIKEFAVHDGDGIRTTVFMKGCPLQCKWCHNPEGLSVKPELFVKHTRCAGCGLCKAGCEHEDCKPYGRCLHVCPDNLLSVVGKVYESGDLAAMMLKRGEFFKKMGGGVTVSGGEPLMQVDFVYDFLSNLNGIHRAIETSGYASAESFKKVVSVCETVIMDIKLADNGEHIKYTGASNKLILENAAYLKSSGIRHLFRTPLIPGITDTEENLSAISKIVGNSPWEKLPYNELAPSKYKSVGRTFVLYEEIK